MLMIARQIIDVIGQILNSDKIYARIWFEPTLGLFTVLQDGQFAALRKKILIYDFSTSNFYEFLQQNHRFCEFFIIFEIKMAKMVIYRLIIAKKNHQNFQKYFLRCHKLAVLQHCAIVWIGICPRELRDSCRTYVFNLYPTSFFCHKFFELLCRALASWMSYMYAQLLVRFWILTKFLGMHSLQKNWCTNGDNPRKLSNLLWSPNHPSPFPLLV